MLSHFNTATVAELTGASIRQLDHWARTGLLKPSGRDATGKGSKRLYTFPDIIALQMVFQLRERNCPLQKVRQAIRELKRQYPNLPQSRVLAQLTLLTDGKEVYLLTDEREVMAIVTRQVVWSVPLGHLILDTNKKVEALPHEQTLILEVQGKTFHLVISRDTKKDMFVAECRELPGTLQSGTTLEEAAENARGAIESVLAHQSRKRHRVGSREMINRVG